MNTVYWVTLCILSCVGLAQIISWLICLRRRPKGLRRSYYVIPLYDEPDRLEAQLHYSVSRIRWNGQGNEIILLADMGMGEEARAICASYMEGHPGLLVCRGSELERTMEQLDQVQAGLDRYPAPKA